MAKTHARYLAGARPGDLQVRSISLSLSLYVCISICLHRHVCMYLFITKLRRGTRAILRGHGRAICRKEQYIYISIYLFFLSL